MDEYRRIREALAEHADVVFGLLAVHLAYLGAKLEWSLDDNLDTTEDVVRLADRVGLPSAGGQDMSALEFYRAAATHLGLDVD